MRNRVSVCGLIEALTVVLLVVVIGFAVARAFPWVVPVVADHVAAAHAVVGGSR